MEIASPTLPVPGNVEPQDPPTAAEPVGERDAAVDSGRTRERIQPRPSGQSSGGWVLSDLLKLRIQLDQADGLNAACQILAESVANLFSCENVFVTVRKGNGGLQVAGHESDPSFDCSPDQIISAQREVTPEHPVAAWPASGSMFSSLVHRSLVSENYPIAVSFLMTDRNQEVFGVVTLIGSRLELESVCAKMTQLLELVVPNMALHRKANATILQRIHAYIRQNTVWRLKWAIIAALAMVFFMIPIPHRLQCDTEVKPVMRRFVSAPFDGVLKTGCVRAGDPVEKGDVLARLDEDEIRLQRSSLEAEKEKYRKQKSSALAQGKTLEMQQAQLDYRRLLYKNDLLSQRSQNLEISSPISGIILKSALEDAEGAPLSQGQVLFEIAPLDRMIFNLYLPQEDVAYVSAGMKVTIQFDACPSALPGTIKRIRPQATLFEDQSVFVAEVEFDNRQGLVKPGMRGYATIFANHQSIGWILFRKPYHRVKRLFGF